jgi:hypothetical protein
MFRLRLPNFIHSYGYERTIQEIVPESRSVAIVFGMLVGIVTKSQAIDRENDLLPVRPAVRNVRRLLLRFFCAE